MIEFIDIDIKYKIHKSAPGLINAVNNFFHRQYEEVHALKNISFKIDQGKIIGLLGSNGAGKTTMLKVLTGIIYPSAGSVYVEGFVPYERKKEFKKKISFVMGQKSQLWWDLPAMQSFLMNKSIYEIEEKQFTQTLNELIDLFEVRDIVNIQVRKLSFGQRMKMEIIGALLHRPEVVFLDEPTIGLDFNSQHAIRNFVIEYNKKYGATFIITSHNLNDIETVCNDLMIINKGEMVLRDSLKNVLSSFSDEKIVNITCENMKHDGFQSFGDVTCKEGNEFEIRVKKEQLKELIGLCYDNSKIQDVNIKDIPLEFVVNSIINNTR